ncbi:HipA N-terminal domain-containing protein [Photorhabdus akhurstii]|uniref:HipA N-terminal domain-containing protein n=1 Tax=Photorhabdus akhurstii TaxID=171438 RepID=UPI002F95A2E8
MISNNKEAYVWIWLPEQTEPVVAGRLEEFNGRILFNYGKSYLERFNSQPPSISIYEPELPLKSGIISPQSDLTIPGCIRDASPDAWGRRVIINKKLGLKGADTETTILNEITYLLESGSDRIGALDFQLSPSEYTPRSIKNVSLEELVQLAEHGPRH